MTITTSHKIEHTAHVWAWNRRYKCPVMEPVMRRLFGIRARTFALDILRNNAYIARPYWSRYYNIGTITIAVVRKD